MFLRWETRHKQHWRGQVTHRALLVKSVRVEGTVRQQHLAYIGSLVATRGQFSPWAVSRFWKEAEESFDALAFPSEQRVQLRAAIAHRIGPRPSEAELQQHWNNAQTLRHTLASLSLVIRSEGKEGESPKA